MSNFVAVSSGRNRVWVRLWLCGELVVNLPCSGRMSSPQNLLGVGFLRYSYTVVCQLGGSSTLLLSLSLSRSNCVCVCVSTCLLCVCVSCCLCVCASKFSYSLRFVYCVFVCYLIVFTNVQSSVCVRVCMCACAWV